MSRSPHTVATLIAAELHGAILCANARRARRCVFAAQRADRTGRARGAVACCIATAETLITSAATWAPRMACDALADMGAL